MPYKNKERQALASRGCKRTYRHGPWRQTYVDCNGMCQYPVNGGICGNLEFLEFHEPFGEINGQDMKFQQRVLLCPDHHAELEGENVREMVKNQWQGSMLQNDVAMEILLCGGYQQWLDRYNLLTSKN
ncbi:hypothetical protein ES703_32929 [subsurface metagenome]